MCDEKACEAMGNENRRFRREVNRPVQRLDSVLQVRVVPVRRLETDDCGILLLPIGLPMLCS
jgi:hypothetical protein